MAAATEKQWREFWQRLGASGDPTSIWQRLAAAYSEDWRKYHNLVHIGHCLNEFATVTAQASQPLAVEAAIWFHDVIYDTHRKDNEERSADMAVEVLRSAKISDAFIETVRQLILATKHNQAATENDAKLLTDIDLSILGQNENAYAEFEQQIRSEYSWVSDSDFAKGRSAVLQSFISRPQIFATPAFAKYESPARTNLAWAIARLAG